MNGERGSLDPRGSRPRCMALCASLGLFGAACMQEGASAPEDAPVAHAQVAAVDASVPGELLAAEIVGYAGSGCTVGAKRSDVPGRLQLAFEGYDLLLPPGGGTAKTKECTLQISVPGASRHRSVQVELIAVGNVALDSAAAEVRFEASAAWPGRGPRQAARPRALPGRQIVQWRDHARWSFAQEAPCPPPGAPSDLVTITTALSLSSASTVRATGDLTSLTVEARALPQSEAEVCPET